MVMFGIYLDSLIHSKFDGQKWQLPAVVYSRPLELFPGQRLSVQQMLHELPIEPLPLWLTAHRELRDTPRLRVIFDALAQAFARPF